MSYQLLNPPPIQNNITKNEKLNTPFKMYFTNLNNSIQATILPINYTSAQTSTTQQGAVLQHPVYSTTAEVNSIDNPPDGVSLYDNEAQKMKFRVNGVWEVFP